MSESLSCLARVAVSGYMPHDMTSHRGGSAAGLHSTLEKVD